MRREGGGGATRSGVWARCGDRVTDSGDDLIPLNASYSYEYCIHLVYVNQVTMYDGPIREGKRMKRSIG